MCNQCRGSMWWISGKKLLIAHKTVCQQSINCKLIWRIIELWYYLSSCWAKYVSWGHKHFKICTTLQRTNDSTLGTRIIFINLHRKENFTIWHFDWNLIDFATPSWRFENNRDLSLKWESELRLFEPLEHNIEEFRSEFNIIHPSMKSSSSASNTSVPLAFTCRAMGSENEISSIRVEKMKWKTNEANTKEERIVNFIKFAFKGTE